LQRLYSTFPGGWPGFALLLLRGAIGVTLIIQGAGCLLAQDSGIGAWGCLLMLVTGVALLLGFLSPIGGALAAFGAVGMMFLFPLPGRWNLFSNTPLGIDFLIMAIASALLGPGAFSLDAFLFGRRKVIIPEASSRRKVDDRVVS